MVDCQGESGVVAKEDSWESLAWGYESMTVKMKGVSWPAQDYPLNLSFLLSWVPVLCSSGDTTVSAPSGRFHPLGLAFPRQWDFPVL